MSKKGCFLLSAGIFFVICLCGMSLRVIELFQYRPSPQQNQNTNLITIPPTALEGLLMPDFQSSQDDESQGFPFPIAYAIVLVPKAEIYSGPGFDFDIVLSVYDGDELPVFGITDDKKWLQVLDNSSWVDASLVSTTIEFPTISGSITNTPQPQELLTPTVVPLATPTFTPVPELIIDVPQILNKSVAEVEEILGVALSVDRNDDNDDILAGGEYRDYQIGKYSFFISFDRNGIAKGFQILDGLSSENYSLKDWEILLARFGLVISTAPNRSAPAALYWNNHEGYGIAIAAAGTSGAPVWTVQIEDAAVFMR